MSFSQQGTAFSSLAVLVVPVLCSFLLLLPSVSGEIYYQETFSGNEQEFYQNWIHSNHKYEAESAEFSRVSGGFAGAGDDISLVALEDFRHYTVSTRLPSPIKLKEREQLVLQYSVAFPQRNDCGGGFVKLFSVLKQASWHSDSSSSITFGPDICGTDQRRILFQILANDGVSYSLQQEVRALTNRLTNTYTLVLDPVGNYFNLYLNQRSRLSGSLSEHLFDQDGNQYVHDPQDPLDLGSLRFFGIDIWLVKGGSVFDNFFLGNELGEAFEFDSETLNDQWKANEKMNETKWKKQEAERRESIRQEVDRIRKIQDLELALENAESVPHALEFDANGNILYAQPSPSSVDLSYTSSSSTFHEEGEFVRTDEDGQQDDNEDTLQASTGSVSFGDRIVV